MRILLPTTLGPAPILLAVAALLPALLPLPARAAEDDGPVLVGEDLSRAEIEEVVPSWRAETAAAEVDADAVASLARVEPGARVTVFLGTWCSDSAREVPRFWRALDALGEETGAAVPFALEYVGVDRDKMEPLDRVIEVALELVPTFVVYRDGREAGRVVEESPHGIENDLLALLDGEASGTISTREDL